MKTICSTLKEEAVRLKEIMQQASKRVRVAPQGFLRISNKRGRVEYYCKGVENCGSNGRYLKKEEHGLTQRIAQRDYDIQVIKWAEKRIRAIEVFLKTYEKTDLRDIYANTNMYRKELIEAFVVSDEEYIKSWLSVQYRGKSFLDEEQQIITERGERVRSKSEKIIADKLYDLGIPYRYEYPLILEGNIKIYPDFTILKMPEREEVYLEHLGMMDNSEYIDGVIYKLNTYERNGIYFGVNLFFTHESKKNPLNTRTLDGLVRKLFC